jgi:hypothetical protein
MLSFFIQLPLGSTIVSLPVGCYEDVPNSIYEEHVTHISEAAGIANNKI